MIIGRLGADPEIKEFADGGQIVNCRVATWRNFYNKDKKEWETITEWHRVTLKGKAALYLSDVKKGDMVTVEGETKTRQYETDSGTRYITELVGILKALPKPKPDSQMDYHKQQNTTSNPSHDHEGASPDAQEDDLPF